MSLPALSHHSHIADAWEAHNRFKAAILSALLAAPDRDRKPLVVAMAALSETPAASLAQRLIDLAPARDRATLREQIL